MVDTHGSPPRVLRHPLLAWSTRAGVGGDGWVGGWFSRSCGWFSRCSPSILPQYESVNGPSYLHSAIFTGKVDFVITARVSRKGCRMGGDGEEGGWMDITWI